MAGSYGYDRLDGLQDSQDIAEYIDMTWTPNESDTAPILQHVPSNSSLPSYYQELDRQDAQSTTSGKSGSSISRFKKGLNRIRQRPVMPRYLQGSIRRHPAADIKPTRIGRGVWNDQLLVDRSLRTMALLMCLFALAMLVLVCVNAKEYTSRLTNYTSSIGGPLMDCKKVSKLNGALLLLINIPATMILGMSNTYQQLVTSLKVGDLKNVFEKQGDSRVGTNSPFNIQHKSEGKVKSWAAWLLLICTSVPIHFLANSLIGPSYILQPPQTVLYNETSYAEMENMTYYSSSLYSYSSENYIISDHSFICWSAFRTGRAHLPEPPNLLADAANDLDLAPKGSIYNTVVVTYARGNCSGLENSTIDIKKMEDAQLKAHVEADYFYDFQFEDKRKDGRACKMGKSVACTLQDPVPLKCRLNVRMNAAFILLAALVIKAAYMVTVNLLARGQLKRQLLTFGDVIVASASNPELRVQGECMVNAHEAYRRSTTHTCHKHCKNKQQSKTGDELGHCQKCKKWNSTNKFSNEPQPTIATKIKRSLISNLGNTALSQMVIMSICSLALISASVAVAAM